MQTTLDDTNMQGMWHRLVWRATRDFVVFYIAVKGWRYSIVVVSCNVIKHGTYLWPELTWEERFPTHCCDDWNFSLSFREPEEVKVREIEGRLGGLEEREG